MLNRVMYLNTVKYNKRWYSIQDREAEISVYTSYKICLFLWNKQTPKYQYLVKGTKFFFLRNAILLHIYL